MKPKLDVQKLLQGKKKNYKNQFTFDKALVDLGVRIVKGNLIK